MLLSSNTGHRLEPMCEMRCALFDGPILHGLRNYVCDVQLQMHAVINGLVKYTVHILGKTFFHHIVVKYHTSENLGNIHFDILLFY